MRKYKIFQGIWEGYYTLSIVNNVVVVSFQGLYIPPNIMVLTMTLLSFSIVIDLSYIVEMYLKSKSI